MLKDEFQRLINLFREGAEGKPIKLDEVFSQSLQFFEHLKVQIQKGTPEEKREALVMMTEMYKEMIEETKKITQQSGMTEEQLLTFAENPGNFTPEQWEAIQSSKDRVFKAGTELAKVVQGLFTAQPPESVPGQEPGKVEEKKAPSPTKKAKRDKWMRS